MCILHLQHMSIWTSHISAAQKLLTAAMTVLDSADVKCLNLHNSKKIKAFVIETQRNQVQLTREHPPGS